VASAQWFRSQLPNMFKNKALLITGGTGSFGNAVLRRFLKTDIKQIRIFSRDEKKQDDMRHDYKDPKLKFYIGDVRQLDSVQEAMFGVDFVFHAAALKQVPSCEFYPMEAIRTNALGADNVLQAALDNRVQLWQRGVVAGNPARMIKQPRNTMQNS
jgi:UDP-glucose 4-epimerase